MSLTKQNLLFDEADIAGSDQVGAHILGSSSAKITSTLVSGKEALDVNVANTISTQLTSEYAEDSAHSSGDNGVAILGVRQDTLAASVDADGDYASLKVNALGEVYVHDTDVKAELVAANASLDAIEASVAAIDIDTSSIITELQAVNTELDTQTGHLASIAAEDFATETTLAAIKAQTDQFVFDTGRLKVLADIALESDVADDAADTENPLKVGTRAVSGLLSAISASGDKANMISDMYRRVRFTDAPSVGASVASVAVAATATQIDASALAGRTRIMVQNVGAKDIYIGFSNAVAVANGLKVAKGAVLELPFGEDLDLYGISDGGSSEVRLVQIG